MKSFIYVLVAILLLTISTCYGDSISLYVNLASTNTSSICGSDDTIGNACSNIQLAISSTLYENVTTSSTTKVIYLVNGTYSGDGNVNLYISNMSLVISSIGQSEDVIIDLENNGTISFISLVSSNSATPLFTNVTLTQLQFINAGNGTVINQLNTSLDNYYFQLQQCNFDGFDKTGAIIDVISGGDYQYIHINQSTFNNISGIDGMVVKNRVQESSAITKIFVNGSTFTSCTSETGSLFSITIPSLVHIVSSQFQSNDLYSIAVVTNQSIFIVYDVTIESDRSTSASLQTNTKASIYIDSVTFTNNYSPLLQAINSTLVNVTSTTITNNNNTKWLGSALGIQSTESCIITNTIISNNTSPYSVAISLYETGATISDSVFSNNIATGTEDEFPSTIYVTNCPSVTLTNVTITDNQSPISSALYCQKSSNITLTNVESSNNTLVTGGGANNGGSIPPLLECDQCFVYGNSASDYCITKGNSDEDHKKRKLNGFEIAAIIFLCIMSAAGIFAIIYKFINRKGYHKI